MTSSDWDEIDQLFAEFCAGGATPGLGYGVVADGALTHFAAFGTASEGDDRAITGDSVFRIASMTKSFTASAILLLRDRGELRLDDPVADVIRELAGLRLPTHDSPAMTIRHLLTMTAGLPTDDPWGDRLESMPPEAFTALLDAGFSFARAPGTSFEYSNLGYAILGRVIERVTRGGYRDFVRTELLEPLAMTATTYDPSGVPPERLVPGHRKIGETWTALPTVQPGSFSPMGGVLSSINDLAIWVAGFLSAEPPRGDDGADTDMHPLKRASRREMQRQQQFVDVGALVEPADPVELIARSIGYGFGLRVEHSSNLGHVVSHSGGYPGYGSHMRWHPASGLGIVTMSNATYAGAWDPASAALGLLVKRAGTVTRPVQPWPATVRAAAQVGELLTTFARTGEVDTTPGTLFADNVELDVPPEERRTRLAQAAELIGAADPQSESRPEPESESDGRFGIKHDGVASASWSVPAARGRLDVEIRLTPERPTRLQTLQLTAVPDPPPALLEIAHRLVQAIALAEPRWPDSVAGSDTVDRHRFERMATLARAFAPTRDGRRDVELKPAPVSGDGTGTATFTIVTGEVEWTLALTIDADATLTQAELRLTPKTSP